MLISLFLSCSGGNHNGDDSSETLSYPGHSSESSDENNYNYNDKVYAASVTYIDMENKITTPRANWEAHFDELNSLGIDRVICSCTALTPYAVYSRAYYPTGGETKENKKSSFTEYINALENLLAAAETKGIKVFVGLNYAEEWVTVRASNTDWNAAQAERAAEIAATLHSFYAEKYPNAFYGWYFPWRMNNSYIVHKTRESADLLKRYKDIFRLTDPSMPVLFTTVLGNDFTAAKTAEAFAEMLSMAGLDENDIYCCVDGIGTGQMRMDSLDYYYRLIIAEAKKASLNVWAGCETTVYGEPSQTALLSRFITQLEKAGNHSETIAALSYSDAYSANFGASPSVRGVYLSYVQSGEMEKEIPPDAPQITCVEISGRNALSVKVSVFQQTYAVGILRLYINGVQVAEYKNTSRPNPKTVYEESFYLNLSDYPGEIIIKAAAEDITGNVSEIGVFKYR